MNLATATPWFLYMKTERVTPLFCSTKKNRNDTTVTNGKGYRSFMVDCSLEAGDGVQVWAFRWPRGIRPCLLIAKDGVCPARNP